MVKILAGLITYLLLARYCRKQHQEKVSIRLVREVRIKIQNEARDLDFETPDTQVKLNFLHTKILQEVRAAVGFLVDTNNREWLVEKNGFLRPWQAKAQWLDQASLARAAKKNLCPGKRMRYNI